MWADPMDDEAAVHGDFTENPERDCSVYFGKKPVKSLLKKNKLLSVFRGHQVKQDGFHMHKWGSRDSFPYVITIFSAPNYCGEFDNAGAMMSVDETLMCSFQILKPAEKRQRFNYQGGNGKAPQTA